MRQMIGGPIDRCEKCTFKKTKTHYSFSMSHFAAKRQLTKLAVEAWILVNRISPAEKGVRLTEIWRKVVGRRTALKVAFSLAMVL